LTGEDNSHILHLNPWTSSVQYFNTGYRSWSLKGQAIKGQGYHQIEIFPGCCIGEDYLKYLSL